MSYGSQDSHLQLRFKRVASAIDSWLPAPPMNRLPRRASGRQRAKFMAADALVLLLGTGTGFTIGRARDVATTPTPTVDDAAVAAAIQWVLVNSSTDLFSVAHSTSAQVKEMTRYQFDDGAGSAWKTGRLQQLRSPWASGVGMEPSPALCDCDLRPVDHSRPDLGPGDLVAAPHYSVATFHVYANGAIPTDPGFGFPPVGPSVAPLCWNGLPNSAG